MLCAHDSNITPSLNKNLKHKIHDVNTMFVQ